jgi:predicted  nucleic acid-binding Zn-ribbon protein
MDPFRLQTIEAEIAKATAELDEARKELRSAREAQEALREEARRKGVPPGWLDQP